MVNLKRILKCPFCGNTDLEVVPKSEGIHGELGTGYIVRCNYLKCGCGANGGSRETEDDAIQVWNKRVCGKDKDV